MAQWSFGGGIQCYITYLEVFVIVLPVFYQCKQSNSDSAENEEKKLQHFLTEMYRKSLFAVSQTKLCLVAAILLMMLFTLGQPWSPWCTW